MSKTDGFIDTIIEKVGCTKHHAKKSQPCWAINSGIANSRVAFAVCNFRAKAAGFKSKIDPRSLRRN